MGDDNGLGIIAFVAFATGVLIGGWLVSILAENDWHKLAIQHNAAHYDPETGVFTWNDEKD